MPTPTERTPIYRTLARDREPTVQVVEIVAELEGKAVDEMTPAYECLGNVLEGVFSEPPVDDAQVEIAFSYEGYRVTIEQDGGAQFVEQTASPA